MGQIYLCRRNFIGGFYGASEIFANISDTPYEISPVKGKMGYFSPPYSGRCRRRGSARSAAGGRWWSRAGGGAGFSSTSWSGTSPCRARWRGREGKTPGRRLRATASARQCRGRGRAGAVRRGARTRSGRSSTRIGSGVRRRRKGKLPGSPTSAAAGRAPCRRWRA